MKLAFCLPNWRQIDQVLKLTLVSKFLSNFKPLREWSLFLNYSLLVWFQITILADIGSAGRGLRPEREVLETNPALTILDIFKLFKDFFFTVSGALDNLPELHKLLFSDLTIAVDIDLVKELICGEATKALLPVVESLVLVDSMAVIHVKYIKDLIDFLKTLCRELILWQNKYQTKSKVIS